MGPLTSYARENPDRFRLHLFVDSVGPQESRTDLQVGRIGKAHIIKALQDDSAKTGWWKRMSRMCGPEPMVGAIAGPYGRNFSQGRVGGALAELGCSSEQVYKF
ncbi:hypothetical protein MPER_12502 [Moniliophthora perniciosa FA553]|nr:hypothetical protein MPER_12502 [Moniliophthora perniciosa FA553]